MKPNENIFPSTGFVCIFQKKKNMTNIVLQIAEKKYK